ncbi:peroxisomal acyl-coenzyme A oxidase 3, partial [Brachionus plicatilis]
QFVINTPSIEDSKVWVGNMGKTATHSAVYAQLYTPDGQCHGLHIFIVPIRDPNTMWLMPGVVCGDMGPKAGLNGVDNGFATFNKVRIPRENMLNKTGDVTPEGKYVSPIKDAKKRFGISLGALSNGRVGLTYFSYCFMNMALTIGVRYAAVRRQFGSDEKSEIPIIEYQLHQYRLMPRLALCYVLKNYSFSLFNNLVEFYIGMFSGDDSERQAEFGKEIHALSSASKPYASWMAQECIQECREACGGHGYLKASRLSYLRNTNDPIQTFEGDNNVLLQQTSNFLISNFEEYLKTKKIADSPLEIARFLNSFETNISLKFNCQDRKDLLSQKVVMEMFDWLICYVTKISYEKLKKNLDKGLDLFTARNENQIFFSKTLATIFMERQLIERFIRKINENKDESLQKILDNILYLSAYYLLDKHVGIFYQGSYFSSEKPVFMIREAILELCTQMKNEAVAMVDAIAPPDYVLNSVLGNSDGLVYENLYNAMIQSNGAFEPIKIPKSKL